METVTFRLLRIRPRAAVVMPLPTELTTPPVTKMYFGMGPFRGGRWSSRTPDRRRQALCDEAQINSRGRPSGCQSEHRSNACTREQLIRAWQAAFRGDSES